MKTILLLLLVVSCGSKKESDPFLFEVTNINRNWDAQGTSKFSGVDLSSLAGVTFRDVKRNGTSSDCVYSAVQNPYNTFYGSFELTYVSGDMFICSQYVGTVGYEAVNDTRKGYEYLNISNVELR